MACIGFCIQNIKRKIISKVFGCRSIYFVSVYKCTLDIFFVNQNKIIKALYTIWTVHFACYLLWVCSWVVTSVKVFKFYLNVWLNFNWNNLFENQIFCTVIRNLVNPSKNQFTIKSVVWSTICLNFKIICNAVTSNTRNFVWICHRLKFARFIFLSCIKILKINIVARLFKFVKFKIQN